MQLPNSFGACVREARYYFANITSVVRPKTEAAYMNVLKLRSYFNRMSSGVLLTYEIRCATSRRHN